MALLVSTAATARGPLSGKHLVGGVGSSHKGGHYEGGSRRAASYGGNGEDTSDADDESYESIDVETVEGALVSLDGKAAKPRPATDRALPGVYLLRLSKVRCDNHEVGVTPPNAPAVAFSVPMYCGRNVVFADPIATSRWAADHPDPTVAMVLPLVKKRLDECSIRASAPISFSFVADGNATHVETSNDGDGDFAACMRNGAGDWYNLGNRDLPHVFKFRVQPDATKVAAAAKASGCSTVGGDRQGMLPIAMLAVVAFGLRRRRARVRSVT